MAFDGVVPEKDSAVSPAEKPLAIPQQEPSIEALRTLQQEVVTQVENSQQEATQAVAAADALVADTRDDVAETAAAIDPEIQRLAEEKKKLLLLRDRSEEIARAARVAQETARVADEAVREGAGKASYFDAEIGLDETILQETPAESDESMLSEENEEHPEALLEALQQKILVEKEAVTKLEEEREAVHEREVFFKEILEMVLSAKREAEENGQEISPEIRDKIITHCKQRENTSTFAKDLNLYAADKLQNLDASTGWYTDPGIETPENFADELLKKSVEQLENRVTVIEETLAKDTLGELIAQKKQSIETFGSKVDEVQNALTREKVKQATVEAQVGQASVPEAEAPDEDQSDQAESDS